MKTRHDRRLVVVAGLLAAVVTGCSGSDADSSREPSGRAAVSTEPSPATSPTAVEVAEEGRALPPGVSEPPSWLGRRVLPTGPDGYGMARRTPPLLRNRRLATQDFLPPPASDRFTFSIDAVPRDVVRRSTWRRACPVGLDDLDYVTVSFWGFDERPHTGELIVNRSVARDVVSVFKALYRARWPIEEMRVTTKAELDAPPTGDGNNTGAFVCRPSRAGSDWSEHAFGLAVDVNPFHNPYVRGDLVLPERALAYRDRDRQQPGMIRSGDVVTRAFSKIGWGWGGTWTSSKDWMHFSSSGR